MAYDINHLMTVGHMKAIYDSVKNRIKAVALSPIYVGDFLIPKDDHVNGGCCIRIGDLIYAFCGPNETYALENHTNVGYIRVFDLIDNVELTDEKIVTPLGHANSVAYDADNDVVYVASGFDYSSGTKQAWKYLYQFDGNMSPIGTDSTPTVPGHVAYDSVRHKLYYATTTANEKTDIYVKNDQGEWEFYTELDLTGMSDTGTAYQQFIKQDMAVYDGKYFFSSTYGVIAYGELLPEHATVEGYYIRSFIDNDARFYMGELEGMEFTDGHLYAISITSISTDVSNPTIIELPVGMTMPYGSNISGITSSVYDSSYLLDENTVSKFALGANEIRSLLQIKTRLISPNKSVVVIDTGSTIIEDYDIRIDRDIMLKIGGTYQCKSLQTYVGDLNIQTMGNDNMLILTSETNQIEVKRCGSFTLSGSGNRLHVSLPNAENGDTFIQTGYDNVVLKFLNSFDSVEGYHLRIGGDEEVLSPALYMGTQRVSITPFGFGKSYVQNSYITQSDFNSGFVFDLMSNYLILAKVDIVLSTALPNDGTQIKIGQMTRGIRRGIVVNVPSEAGNATIRLEIDTSRNIYISAKGNTVANDHYSTQTFITTQ